MTTSRVPDDVLRLVADGKAEGLRGFDMLTCARELLALRARVAELEGIADALDGHALRNGLTPWYLEHGGIIQRRYEADLKVRKDAREYWIEADFLDDVARRMVRWRAQNPQPKPLPPISLVGTPSEPGHE